MSDLVEIRWHGRGGQGSKTASLLLGKVASDLGFNVQAFPEYGPERMGAPVLAFNRISSGELTVHCQIESPQVVVVLDPTLLDVVDVTENLTDDGKIMVNTKKTPQKLKEQLNLKPGQTAYTIDANAISHEELGRVLPNTPMLGALVGVTEILPWDGFMEMLSKEFDDKFSGKPEIIEGNMESVRRAAQEVKGE